MKKLTKENNACKEIGLSGGNWLWDFNANGNRVKQIRPDDTIWQYEYKSNANSNMHGERD